jgi:Tfp pilus assembly protein PilE
MHTRGITLLELLIASILMVIVTLALVSIDTFSRHHMKTSDRRSRLQNEITFVLENMQKYVSRGVGKVNASSYNVLQYVANGFRIRVDLRNTPSDFTDDLYFDYVLSVSNLTCSCGPVGAGPAACPADCPAGGEILSSHMVTGYQSALTMPNNPTLAGYYVNITDNGSAVEVGLAARWDPTTPKTAENPQVEMKTKMCATGSSAH